MRLSRIVGPGILPYSRQQYPTVLQVTHLMITENGAESEAETEAKTEAETEKEAETGAENQAEGESNKEQCQLALQDHVSKVPPTPSPPPSQAHNYGYYMNSIAGKIAD